ncbi:MAG: 6-phosphofructokinase, partial [Nitrospinota bacterium]
MSIEFSQGSIGILVGGGPAPGLNGVISAVTIEARKKGLSVYGIYDGYKWLVQEDEATFLANTVELRISDVSRIHFDGGSLLRTSRINPVKLQGGVEKSIKNLKRLGINYVVTIGGDDTAYAASELAKAAEGELKFAHVPKTIDNDLPLPSNMPTFGYQTARDLGSMMIKNLMEDARTTGKWYIAVAMGRHAGHLALGITKSSGATAGVIAEEFGDDIEKIDLKHVCDIFETTIIKRRAMGNNHGVLVVAEGVAEKFDVEDFKKIPGVRVEYDGYDHLRLAEIDLGKLIKDELKSRFNEKKDPIPMVEINIGYVLRCAPPIPYDQEYTKDLGFHAVNYLLSDRPEHQKNSMICVVNGELVPLYFDDMIDPVTK